MKVTAEELKSKMIERFPLIGFQWVASENYEVISLSEVKTLIEITDVEKLEFIDKIAECEYFALQLHSEVKRIWAIEEKNKEVIAFGEVFGIEFRGRRLKHSLNVSLTDQGIYLIEPQTDEIWQATGNDTVLCDKF